MLFLVISNRIERSKRKIDLSFLMMIVFCNFTVPEKNHFALRFRVIRKFQCLLKHQYYKCFIEGYNIHKIHVGLHPKSVNFCSKVRPKFCVPRPSTDPCPRSYLYRSFFFFLGFWIFSLSAFLMAQTRSENTFSSSKFKYFVFLCKINLKNKPYQKVYVRNITYVV